MDFMQCDIGDNIQVIKDQDDYKILMISDETGEGRMTVYKVFDGVYLTYNDFHIQHCFSCFRPNEPMFYIEHCREGRIEWDTHDGRYLYIEAGDMLISCKNFTQCEFSFPLRHYHGLSIAFSIEKVKKDFFPIWEDFSIDIKQLCEKFCSKESTYVIRAESRIEHIFSELYHIPECARNNYFKVKMLELLIFLDITKPLYDCERRYFEKKHVEKVKAIAQLMTKNLDRKFTLEELSKQFEFPLTSMQQCFKGVFGTSIYAYMRAYRMNAAAVMLQKSQKSIMEIAGLVGYENAGKFSAAFASVIGMKPSEYRRVSNKMEQIPND